MTPRVAGPGPFAEPARRAAELPPGAQRVPRVPRVPRSRPTSCRSASLAASAALLAAGAVGGCRESSRPDVPAVTTAQPSSSEPVFSGPATMAVPQPYAPAPPDAGSDASAAAPARGPSRSAISASFLEGDKRLELPSCSRLLLVSVKGTVKADQTVLAAGDVLEVLHPQPISVKATGLGVEVVQELVDCAAGARPVVTLHRGKDTPELRWAGGTMRAHLDVHTKADAGAASPLYLGRLEGTAGVAEHVHTGSIETLIAIEASGTFTLDGKESRLGPRQLVTVPAGVKHAWKPDPGSSLVAIQLYEPPGPEQRFVALAAAERDAGKP